MNHIRAAGTLLFLTALVAVTAPAFADTTHIYVAQANGQNTSTTAGTAGDPFKSITYAMGIMTSRATPDPWFVHVKGGTYDADPAKPDNQREFFPIDLREGVTIQGDDGASACIISGAFSGHPASPLVRGDTLLSITLHGLTLKDMKRVSGGGGGCELTECGGAITNCVVESNQSSGVYLTLHDNATFTVSGNLFDSNSGAGFMAWNDFRGSIAGNTFIGNTSGGLTMAYAFAGDITGNTFINNSSPNSSASYGGGILLNKWVSGAISDNVFVGNSTNGNGAGGALALTSGGEELLIARNLFSQNTSLHDGGAVLSRGGIGKLQVYSNVFLYNSSAYSGVSGVGGALCTRQDVALINNTFYGGSGTAEQGCVAIYSSAGQSVIENNVFAEVATAIWEGGELDLEIQHNDFDVASGIENILYWNYQPLGNDLEYIQSTLPDVMDNGDWNAGFRDEGGSVT
ncbi:MAG: right-handed parallel beta-helix repeat-containing protein, partial [Candidatus Hydrogenedentes bacterium]|nr:right-handed parallel beta-helix repeat-containing protein [Candidatus Hydrogenedentota bacterium]